MNKPTSGRRLGRLLGRWRGDRAGGAAVEFALLLPVLLLFCFGLIDFTLLMFDYHRAGEATRRGARLAVMESAVANLSGLSSASPITCTIVAGVVNCGAAPVSAAANFTQIVDGMREIYPSIASGNVSIRYSFTGIGDIATPGGIKPLVTIDVTNLYHGFTMLQALPGVADGIVLPAFSTSVIGPGFAS